MRKTTHILKHRQDLIPNFEGGQAAVGHRSQPVGENVENAVFDKGHLQVMLAQMRDDSRQEGDLLNGRFADLVELAVVLNRQQKTPRHVISITVKILKLISIPHKPPSFAESSEQ